MSIDLFTHSDRNDHYAMKLLERNLIWLLKVLNIPYLPGQTQALLPSTVRTAIGQHYRLYGNYTADEAQAAWKQFLALKYECPSPQMDAVVDEMTQGGAQVIDLSALTKPSSFDHFNRCGSPAWNDFEQLTGYIQKLNLLAKEAQRVGQPIFFA